MAADRPPKKRQMAEARMAILGLGYAGFGSDALDDWRQFGTGLVEIGRAHV